MIAVRKTSNNNNNSSKPINETIINGFLHLIANGLCSIGTKQDKLIGFLQ
jgi:hypothetical protein